MFRRWLSSFIKRNKDVILNIAKFIAILIMMSLVATAFFSGLNGKNNVSESENSISIYKPTETVIEGKKLTREEFNQDDEVISNFINYCNNQDIESAYNLLSDDCKKELYSSLDEFKEVYCEKLFSAKREYNMQSWINDGEYHTYKIRYLDDILSTGEYDNSSKGQDYITVVNLSGNKKLNLNGYIKKEEIKKESSVEKIKALVVEKKIYIDYVEYTVKIKNISKSSILLDTGKKYRSVKLVDDNNVEYLAYKDRIQNLNDVLSPEVIRTFNIRFNKSYTGNINDKYIEFSDIVSEVEKYNIFNDYKERDTVRIEI